MSALPVYATVLISMVAFALNAAQPPNFHTRIDLIEVAAVAVDDHERVVTGMAKSEFVLREDGKIVPIATFVPIVADGPREEPSARFVLLVLDDLVTPPALAANIQNIARMFVDRMGDRDMVAVVPLNEGRAASSRNIDEVRSAIDRFRPSGRSIMTRVSEQALRTIGDLARQMADVRHRRKTLVYIGASSIFDPTEAWGRNGDMRYGAAWTDTLRSAEKADVSLYAIDPDGLTGGQYDGARAFADQSGGYAFVNSNFFDRNVNQVWNEAGHYYLIGYERPSSKGKTHTIDVEATRPGIHIRARRTRD